MILEGLQNFGEGVEHPNPPLGTPLQTRKGRLDFHFKLLKLAGKNFTFLSFEDNERVVCDDINI